MLDVCLKEPLASEAETPATGEETIAGDTEMKEEDQKAVSTVETEKGEEEVVQEQPQEGQHLSTQPTQLEDIVEEEEEEEEEEKKKLNREEAIVYYRVRSTD